MIQSDKIKPAKTADLLAFMIFLQNVCLSQKTCSPKCPLKDPYCKCKIISRPTHLHHLNSSMYTKIAALYPLFNKLRISCLFSSCKTCGLHRDDVSYKTRYGSIWHTSCSYFLAITKLQNIINSTLTNWRHCR